MSSDLERLNHFLSVRLSQCQDAQREWKARSDRYRRSARRWRAMAKEREQEILRLRAELGLKERRRIPPKRKPTVEEWRQHDLILARIRSIPDRPV